MVRGVRGSGAKNKGIAANGSKEVAERNAARDAAFYANYKQNEVNSFINSGNSGRDTIVNTYGRTKSGLSDIRGGGGVKASTTAESGGAKVTPTPIPKPPKPTNPQPDTTQEVSFNQGKKIPSNLRYPQADIYDDTDYLKIDVLQYKPLGFPEQKDLLKVGLKRSKDQYRDKKDGKLTNLLGSIILPIPQDISDTNSTGWGQDSLNIGAAYAVGATNDIITDDKFFEGILDAIKTASGDLVDLVKDGGTQNAVNSSFGAAAANLFGANTSAAGILARSSGQILNPNTELLFNGVKLRSFNFTFNLAPRSDDEARIIQQIVRTFKLNMAPTTGAGGGLKGLFLKSPNVFQLQYMKGAQPHPYLNKFVVAALTNMQVNYTGSGTYMTYHDGMPVHMIMTLSFQELSPIYAEDQEELGGMGY
tara:strand:+ start:9 stop:1265 length:1257 start_codon:yes stop_codon:yes gene_type:complete